jgi:hypothetical protein
MQSVDAIAVCTLQDLREIEREREREAHLLPSRRSPRASTWWRRQMGEGEVVVAVLPVTTANPISVGISVGCTARDEPRIMCRRPPPHYIVQCDRGPSTIVG